MAVEKTMDEKYYRYIVASAVFYDPDTVSKGEIYIPENLKIENQLV